jgi:hypothetical protein
VAETGLKGIPADLNLDQGIAADGLSRDIPFDVWDPLDRCAITATRLRDFGEGIASSSRQSGIFLVKWVDQIHLR